MSILKRKRFFLSLFFLLCLAATYIVSYKFELISYNAQAQTEVSDPAEQQEAVKIPPPIKGVVLKEQQRPQSLDTTDVQILSSSGKKHILKVELAKTNEQRRIGLMFRNVLSSGSGMLFLFDDVRERSFWMKNTWIDLDIIFLRSDGVIHNIHHRAKSRSLEHVKSNGDVEHVLEIGGGEAQRLGITIGDRVLYDGLKSAP